MVDIDPNHKSANRQKLMKVTNLLRLYIKF